MHGIDILILTIIGVSTVISLARGFIREALSLIGWVLAIWVASRFADVLAVYLEAWIAPAQLRFIIGFAALFVATLFVAGMVNYLIGQLVRRTGLSGTDRVVGMLFGVVRGGIVVALLVLLAGLTTIPEGPWWHESVLIAHFEQMADWMQQELAPQVSHKVSMK